MAYPVIFVVVIVLLALSLQLSESEFQYQIHSIKQPLYLLFRLVYEIAYSAIFIGPLVQNNWFTILESKYVLLYYLFLMPLIAVEGILSIFLLFWLILLLEPINILYFIGWQMSGFF